MPKPTTKPTPQSAKNDAAATGENSTVLINVLANDPVGATITAINGVTSAAGWVALAGGAHARVVNSQLQYYPDLKYDYLAPGQTATDTFTYTVRLNNGNLSTASVNVTITGANDAPVLIGDRAATVNEGGSYVLIAADLGFTDPDDTEVMFTVSNVTKEGALLVDGTAATTFTGQQLADGLVSFVHDGRETTSAGFNVSVEDGNEDGSTPTSQAFAITITPVNDAPRLIGDLSATVNEGGSYVLQWTSDLDALDPDDLASGVTFTVSNVTNGTLEVDGSTATTFTVQQLHDGLVTFVHNGSETPSAGFSVSVEDGDEDNSTPVAQAFSFTVNPVNDAPVLTGDRAASVDEGGSYVLTTADLGFTDPDDTASGVTFTASSLSNGTLMVAAAAVTSFTGAQLAAGQVSFVHDGSETNSAGFSVSVDDGNEDNSTPVAQAFSMSVNPVLAKTYVGSMTLGNRQGFDLDDGSTTQYSTIEEGIYSNNDDDFIYTGSSSQDDPSLTFFSTMNPNNSINTLHGDVNEVTAQAVQQRGLGDLSGYGFTSSQAPFYSIVVRTNADDLYVLGNFEVDPVTLAVTFDYFLVA